MYGLYVDHVFTMNYIAKTASDFMKSNKTVHSGPSAKTEDIRTLGMTNDTKVQTKAQLGPSDDLHFTGRKVRTRTISGIMLHTSNYLV